MDIQYKRITVTGGAGFLGRYVVHELQKQGLGKHAIFIPRSGSPGENLLTPEGRRLACVDTDLLIHLAGRVGGIGYNQQNPGSLLYENAVMGLELLETARWLQVPKVVLVGTICAYPKHTPVPFKEENLWQGYPEETNAPYGLAKKLLLVQAQAYRQQYGFNAIYLLPTNLYGPGDNFNPDSSHVIPALIRKIVEAQKSSQNYIEVWGTGDASREFLYVQDAARGIVLAAKHYNEAEPVNLGAGQEIKVKDLVWLIAELMNFKGKVRWNSSRPDGQPRRCLDTARAKKYFGFEATTRLDEGLRQTIDWYSKFKSILNLKFAFKK